MPSNGVCERMYCVSFCGTYGFLQADKPSQTKSSKTVNNKAAAAFRSTFLKAKTQSWRLATTLFQTKMKNLL